MTIVWLGAWSAVYLADVPGWLEVTARGLWAAGFVAGGLWTGANVRRRRRAQSAGTRPT
ncbi:hypothetical protein [Frondihabitans sp. VKM Ac-2883]|uniref:hypothetical protein n=1 Tax=unclassified Frondihabitans TaxID=2626248 RepID=UPI00188A5FB3|nr:hypothetical protein [Frondihabitans sp. VKM Ac-2883]MBF4574953.1 hypothetical protein [Frondihabitans sp. VKM Ac-2883]